MEIDFRKVCLAVAYLVYTDGFQALQLFNSTCVAICLQSVAADPIELWPDPVLFFFHQPLTKICD